MNDVCQKSFLGPLLGAVSGADREIAIPKKDPEHGCDVFHVRILATQTFFTSWSDPT